MIYFLKKLTMPFSAKSHYWFKQCMLVFMVKLMSTFVYSQRLNCSPCIDRSTYNIKAIVHGVSSDPFWKQIQSSSIQAAKDMGIKLDFNLYKEYNEWQMVDDIEAVASQKPDALIVSIPSQAISDAIEDVIASKVPVFGINVGDQVAVNSGVLDFVGLDQGEGGKKSAETFLSLRQNDISQALFINNDVENTAFAERFEGFKNVIASTTQIFVEDGNAADTITNTLTNCPYQAVILSSSSILEQTISAIESNNCQPPALDLATFDTNEVVFKAIAEGKLSFAVSEQTYLQGALPVLMATIFSSTGKKIVPPTTSQTHVYQAGPKIITLDNLPSNTRQTCENDGFPVCPNDRAIDGTVSSCECTDRNKIKIGGVIHGVKTDTFWDPVFSAFEIAAEDMNIELLLDRFEPITNQTQLHEKMSQKMKSLCDQDIKGLFITIPSTIVVPGIKHCQSLNIPIVSINTGIDLAEELGLVHHVGMLEYDAGVGAGDRLIKAGMTRGICLDHEPGNSALMDRCNGFWDAIKRTNGAVEYIGKFDVPIDNPARYKTIVENAVNSDDWSGVGIFLLGPVQTTEALLVQEAHPQVIMGTVDTSSEIYKAIDDGKLLFGITQGPFMQGYMPIPMLTWLSYTGQSLGNLAIQSGPTFVENSPSQSLQICESNQFAVCRPEEPAMTQTIIETMQSEGGTTTVVTTTASSSQEAPASTSNVNVPLAITLSVIIAVILIVVLFMMVRLHKLDKYVKTLQDGGTNVPNLSMKQKVKSMVVPIDKVVEIA